MRSIKGSAQMKCRPPQKLTSLSPVDLRFGMPCCIPSSPYSLVTRLQLRSYSKKIRYSNKNAISNTMKIAVEGCCHGELDAIYASIQRLEREKKQKVDLLLIGGDFQVSTFLLLFFNQ